MTTVYVLTFDAEWLEGRKLVRGEQSFPITAPCGQLNMADVINACQIVASEVRTILYPEKGIQIRTSAWDMEIPPLWDDCGLRVY